MPYVVERGTVIGDNATVYVVGEVVPGRRGELADMEEAGSVRWLTNKEAKQLRDENEATALEALTANTSATGAQGDADADDAGDEDEDEDEES